MLHCHIHLFFVSNPSGKLHFMLTSTQIWIISVHLYEAVSVQNVFHIKVNLIDLLDCIFILIKGAQNAVFVCYNLLFIDIFSSLHPRIYSFQNFEYLLWLLIFMLYNEIFLSYILYRDRQNCSSFLGNYNNLFPVF